MRCTVTVGQYAQWTLSGVVHLFNMALAIYRLLDNYILWKSRAHFKDQAAWACA